jgi:hypothetical protein
MAAADATADATAHIADAADANDADVDTDADDAWDLRSLVRNQAY